MEECRQGPAATRSSDGTRQRHS